MSPRFSRGVDGALGTISDEQAEHPEEPDVPLYEYRCDSCDERFELRRPAAESGATGTCPEGHEGARRMLSVFATVGASSASGVPAGSAPMPAGGCGAGCACAAAR